MESTDKIEPKEDVATHTQQERAFKKKYALSHFSITVIACIIGCILFKSLIASIIVYLLGLFFIPRIIDIFSFIGWHEAPDQYVKYIHPTKFIDGRKFVYYGGLFALWDSLLGIFSTLGFASIPVVILYFLVPISIIVPLIGGIAVILLLKIVILPLVQDVAWFFALDELDKKLNEMQRIIIVGVAVLSLLAAVVYPIYSVGQAKATFNPNAILAEHFAEREQENPYENIDLSNVKVEYAKLATEAVMKSDAPVEMGNGWVYHGCSFEFEYVMNHWRLISHRFDGELTYLGTATYTTEGPFEMKGYTGDVKFTLTVSALEEDGSGNGNLCVTDLQTGEEVYASDFTFSADRDNFGRARFELATEIDMGSYKRDYCFFNFGGEEPAEITIANQRFTFENP